MARCYKSFW